MSKRKLQIKTGRHIQTRINNSYVKWDQVSETEDKSLSKSENKKYCKKNTESAIHHFYLELFVCIF